VSRQENPPAREGKAPPPLSIQADQTSTSYIPSDRVLTLCPHASTRVEIKIRRVAFLGAKNGKCPVCTTRAAPYPEQDEGLGRFGVSIPRSFTRPWDLHGWWDSPGRENWWDLPGRGTIHPAVRMAWANPVVGMVWVVSLTRP